MAVVIFAAVWLILIVVFFGAMRILDALAGERDNRD